MAKILISDDNKDFAELLNSVLIANGYETHVTHDGADAIAYLQDNQEYDLVITDIIMPGQDGFDLIEFTKAKTSAKIIAVSGGGVFLSSKNAVEAIEDQVDACLEKPVQIDELLQCVAKILAK